MEDYKYVEFPKFKSIAPFMSDFALRTHIYEHHAPYEDKLKTLLTQEQYNKLTLSQVITNFKDEQKILNFSKQIFNHNIFWKSIAMNSNNSQAKNKILEYISLNQLVEMANQVFGSGWLWCVWEQNQIVLKVSKNADIPSGTILFNIDLWEHAYYIDHQSNKSQFIKCFFYYLINWDYVDQQLVSIT